MKKSKRLNYTETRQRVEQSHQRVTGESLGSVQVTLLIKHIAWRAQELLNEVVSEFGLNGPGYICMVMINSLPDRVANPSELCDWTGETRANMTRITDELVEKGWLRRVPNLEDRRRVDLSLTEQGLALIEQVMPRARQNNRDVFSVFSEEELALLEKLLLRLSQRLDATP